jgi:hypothetical protein
MIIPDQTDLGAEVIVQGGTEAFALDALGRGVAAQEAQGELAQGA